MGHESLTKLDRTGPWLVLHSHCAARWVASHICGPARRSE
ncbi:hypothetical protein RISK_006124 [Rhodopirellula islandica]|uniref:Uncharacterized protein n=1 Tax=Rhodopirellula islandica TaxID=595434 RepID=A0A0J1B554_RHOIS|nr:hypothetical protein RISK_006124 [Rhodopirellula islandica]